MDQHTKNCIKLEIESLFISFFVDNVNRFSDTILSVVVDGKAQPYQACLPGHISQLISTENENQV